MKIPLQWQVGFHFVDHQYDCSEERKGLKKLKIIRIYLLKCKKEILIQAMVSADFTDSLWNCFLTDTSLKSTGPYWTSRRYRVSR